MSDYPSLITALLLCTTSIVHSQMSPQVSPPGEQSTGVTISLLERKLTDKTLQLRYRIENHSDLNIWLCDVMSVGQADVETLWAEEERTLVVRRRSNIELWFIYRDPPLSRYVRVRAGESRIESLLLPLPLRLRGVVTSEIMPADVEYVERIALEIGYYDEATSEVIRETLAQEEMGYGDEEFYVYHRQGPTLQKERVLRLAIDGLHLRWAEGKMKQSAPNLTSCTRLEIDYQPSIVAYFFPFAGQRALLSPPEKDYLESHRMVSVTDQNSLAIFANDIGQGRHQALTTEGAKAHVVCFENDKRLISLDLYHGVAATDDDDVFYGVRSYVHDRRSWVTGWPDLERITPEIQPFALRIQCARNLQRLNARLRFYAELEGTYPALHDWCDVIARKWQSWNYVDDFVFAPFACPVADAGRCHYAMNADCTPDSPPDTVLLFETKAGWNQHGGPERFTFDNHDPKGGLVLLNDGTVKFIRTKQELRQLRWK